MAFIKAFAGAIGGTFADSWKDFITVPPGLPATFGVAPGVPQGQNAGRGSNTKASNNIITNGSRIVIPEGTALVTMEMGAVTGFVADPGGYEWNSEDLNSQSFLSGGGLIEGLIKQSWERFKFGGQPGSQQMAFFVNLKEIPDLRFGTQSEIYWDDSYMNAQVGAITRGTYTLHITDPILFVKGFLPASYISNGSGVFDFADFDNDAANQLFTEVVASLSAAFSAYTNNPDKNHRITMIQQDAVGFAQSLSAAVEQNYQWKSGRGLEIMRAALAAIEYDEASKALLADVQKADALSGARGNSFLQQSVARGMQAAGENGGDGALGMGLMGMGMNAAGMMGQGLQQTAGVNQQMGVAGMAAQAAQPAASAPAQQMPAPTGQPVAPAAQAPTAEANAAEDPYEHLAKLKGLLDQGVISQEDFDAAKKKVLGI